MAKSRVSIRSKFQSGFLLISVLIVGVVSFTWVDVSAIDRSVWEVFNGPVQAIDEGRSAQRDFDDLRRLYLAASTMPQPQWAQSYAVLHKKVVNDLAHLHELYQSDLLKTMTEHAQNSLAQWDAALSKGNYAAHAGHIDMLATSLESEIDKLVDASREDAFEKIGAIGQKIRSSGIQIGVAGALVLAIGFLVMRFLSSGVITPIERAVYIARKISAGDFREVIFSVSEDETGQLMEALAVMQNSLQVQQEKLLEQSEQLARLAFTDKLTGLYNRRKLEQFAEGEIKSSDRHGRTLSLIILDIDHFKKVNDTYGHPVGDEVLRHVAAVLKAGVRETDLVVRWGGEEFVILLPSTSLENALLVAEKCRRAIESHEFPVVGKKTASFGVVEYRSKDDLDRLVARADSALYRAKQGGRNRVEQESRTEKAVQLSLIDRI